MLGAHYDTVRGSPGADDNASGVAALIEIARMLAERTVRASVRCVAFVNEEWPFYGSRAMGSMVYARAARARGADIRLMISLERRQSADSIRARSFIGCTERADV